MAYILNFHGRLSEQDLAIAVSSLRTEEESNNTSFSQPIFNGPKHLIRSFLF
jgi:hypothetical protein